MVSKVTFFSLFSCSESWCLILILTSLFSRKFFLHLGILLVISPDFFSNTFRSSFEHPRNSSRDFPQTFYEFVQKFLYRLFRAQLKEFIRNLFQVLFPVISIGIALNILLVIIPYFSLEIFPPFLFSSFSTIVTLSNLSFYSPYKKKILNRSGVFEENS